MTLASALQLLACSQEPEGGADDGTSTGGTTAGLGGSGSGGGPTLPRPDFATRIGRLTHDQYQNTISDLFGIDDDVAQAFAPDALGGFRFDSSINHVVDSRLAEQYRTAAETLAERVASDAEVFARVVPCDVTASDCADEFIASFGRKAFRRPLSDAERERFGLLFDEGASLIESGDAFADGVRVVVEALLQSPDFLYRGELGTATNENGRVILSSYELATRISYFLYNSMPDDALLEAADSGALSDPSQVEAEVQRLLENPDTLARIVAFHEQAFDFGRYSRIALDAETFPDVPADIVSRALTASRLFVQDVVENGGGLVELLTAPYAFVDSELAPLYGADVAGDFERVDFDPAERAGLLTQVGFLASHAYAKKTDPIHRGLFVVRDLLCVSIPEPPAGATMTPPPEGAPDPQTTREEVEILTGQDGCVTCHSVINPPGFAFEAFDAAGVARTSEGDVSVDTGGSLEIDGENVTFAGAAELMVAVAESDAAHACYLNKWVEFAHGRQLARDELTWLAEVPAKLSVLELLPLIARDESFMTRPTNEVLP